MHKHVPQMLTTGLLTLTLSALWAGALWGQPPSSISIRSSQTTFPVGAPIELQVIFTNTSNRGISLVVETKTQSAEVSDFLVEVTDAKGKVPKITRYYDLLTGEKAPRDAIANPDDNGIFVGSLFEMVLAPGKAEHLRMNLARLFDLKEPGQYSIRLKRTDPADGIPVMSNFLKITITK